MLFLKLLAAAYLIVAILAVLMVISAIDSKVFRGIFIVLGLAMPFIAEPVDSSFPHPFPAIDPVRDINPAVETKVDIGRQD